MFQKRRKKKTYKKKTYSTARKKITKKNRGILGKILLFLLISSFLLGILGTYIIYKKYIAPLPDVHELERQEIAQASIIYDREGNELYKIFKEKRTYKSFSDINENMINAIVAGEDKRYWENPGIDFIGLVRAVIYRATGRTNKLEGTSTLTQQLIRNMVITNERTAERKIKEMYLAYDLTKNLSKEKILELYLNKISYGSNAFGIEQAAQTFFGKSAKELGVLESSMLASLPKGPSYYSPYSNFERLVGYPYIYPINDPENTIHFTAEEQIQEHKESINDFNTFISNLELKRLTESRALLCGLSREYLKVNISFDADGCSVMNYSDFLTFLNSIRIEIESEDYVFEYQTGRKDFILGRMLEDNYIDFDQYKEALLTSIGFTFPPYKEEIENPHFVFYIREYLEEKYGKEILEQGGLRIYTSLDAKLQEKAEELVRKYADINENKFNAQNAALISLDNQSGEILTMVGGRDYFDEENRGNVNIITSRLQPGSTFKPFVYSIAIDKEIIGSKTPIYDLETTFPGDYTPANFDGEFKQKMNISTALNESRNIPAVKMYYIAGGEKEIMNWMSRLGTKSIHQAKEDYFSTYGKEYFYGASMSLGTAPMTPLELAQAYSVYANMGYKKELQPIIKILDSQGLIVEDNEQSLKNITGKKVIDPSTAFITNRILSDTTTRPEYWNTFLSLNGRSVAAKTGTSTKQFEKNGEKIIYPRNLWTVGYTPQITTVVWAGNNDGSETNFKGNGLEGAAPIWKDFMEFAHKEKAILDWKKPAGVEELDISEISGKLVPQDFPEDLIISSVFKHAPKNYDSNLADVQVDLLCNGKVGKHTPISAIGNRKYVSLTSLRPQFPYWEDPVQEWFRSGEYNPDFLNNSLEVIGFIPETLCQRSGVAHTTEIGTNVRENDVFHQGDNYIEVAYRSTISIKKIDVYLGDILIAELNQSGRKNGSYTGNIRIPEGSTGNKLLTFRTIDNEYRSEGLSYNIRVINKDKMAPEISVSSPSKLSIRLRQGQDFTLKGTIRDRSEIAAINISVNNEKYIVGNTGRSFSETIPSKLLNESQQTVKIEVVDGALNKSYKEVKVEILP